MEQMRTDESSQAMQRQSLHCNVCKHELYDSRWQWALWFPPGCSLNCYCRDPVRGIDMEIELTEMMHGSVCMCLGAAAEAEKIGRCWTDKDLCISTLPPRHLATSGSIRASGLVNLPLPDITALMPLWYHITALLPLYYRSNVVDDDIIEDLQLHVYVHTCRTYQPSNYPVAELSPFHSSLLSGVLLVQETLRHVCI
jgi:hypothetical protein